MTSLEAAGSEAPPAGSGRIVGAVETALGWAVAAILAGLMVLVLTAVALRYLFATGFAGMEEFGIWLHLALIAAGAPLALRGPLAMRLDLVSRRLPPRPRQAADIAADGVSFLAALVLVFGSSAVIATVGGTSPTLGVPEWLRYLLFAASGGLTLIFLLLTRWSEGRIVPSLLSLALAVSAYLLVRTVSVDSDWPPSAFLALAAAAGLLVAAPLAHAFIAAAYIALAFASSLPEPAIVSTSVAGMSRFLLLAIPFFLLAGTLLTITGAAKALVRFAATLVGHRRAGLAQTTLLTGVLFSGASGSSVANAAFGAATFHGELVRNGYPPERAGALIAATSVLDNVIPPSIAFLLLAAATGLSVGSLLLGGFVAGGMMALCLAIAIHRTERTGARMPRASAAERRRAARGALPAFGLGVVVVLGIRFGIVTTTEAAALAAFYTLLLALGAALSPRALLEAFRQAGTEAAAIGLLVGSAAPFAFLLAVDDIAGLIAHVVTSLGEGPVVVLLLSNVVLLVAGLVLDIGAAILLLGPILLPSAIAAGLDPIHFGVILVVNLMIHGLTPPLGILVFVVSGVSKVPAAALFRAVIPYLVALLAALAILCATVLLL